METLVHRYIVTRIDCPFSTRAEDGNWSTLAVNKIIRRSTGNKHERHEHEKSIILRGPWVSADYVTSNNLFPFCQNVLSEAMDLILNYLFLSPLFQYTPINRLIEKQLRIITERYIALLCFCFCQWRATSYQLRVLTGTLRNLVVLQIKCRPELICSSACLS